MVREIKRTRRTELVSPSGTASRMGVVDVYSPNISNMFGAVSDTINTLAENQVKILDAKWQNNFETETTKYLNNKVNGILKSGEKPDLQKFQEETDGYINGVLAGVPERLSINAESYYNQKNLNAFETLRKQANLIEYAELSDSYATNLESTLADVDSFLENNFMTTQSPQESIDAIDQFFATEVTKFLGSHNEKYEALIVASNFKLNKTTQKQAEEALMLSLEQKRVNSVVKSFYQNVDVNNAEQVAEADAQAQLFLRNYSLNEGGVRGVNYEVFEDETGRKIGQDLIDSVVQKGINTYNQTKSLNDFGLKEASRKKMTEDSIVLNELDKQISNITTPVSNQINLFTNLINGEEVPVGPEVFREFLESKGIVANTSDITNLYNKNLAAFNIRNNINLANEDFSLTEILASQENQGYLNTLGLSTEDVVKDTLTEISNFYKVEDTLQGYLSLGQGDEGVANVLYSFMRDNQTLSFGAEQLFSQIGTTRMIDLLDKGDKESIDKWFDEVLPQWASLTNNGGIKFNNISKETNEMFTFFDGLKQHYQPMDIANKWKTVIENRAKTDAAELIPESGAFKSWFKEFESNENRSVTTDYIEAFREARNKNKIWNESFFGFDSEPLMTMIETEQMIQEKFNPDYITQLDTKIEMEALRLTKIDTQGIDDPSIIENVFNQNVFKVMENLIKEEDYGVTLFAPNSGDKFAFHKDAMEKVHGLSNDDALNYVSAFVNTYMKQNYDTDPDLRNAFKDFNDVEKRPSFEEIYKMAESGVFELERIEGTKDYRVKMNLDNAGMLDISPYPYADDTIEIKVDGRDFNPNMYYRTFDTFLNKETEKYLDDNGIDGMARGLIKKFVMSIRQMDAPFDSTEFRSIDQRFQDDIIQFYERVSNDEAFSYANNITNNFLIGGDEKPEDFLIRTAGKIHNSIYEGDSSSRVTDSYEDNTKIVLDTFEERFKTRPGQVAYLLDIYTVYQPDINSLKSAIESGKEDQLLSLFPTMGDYQKRTLLYLFGDEYSETN